MGCGIARFGRKGLKTTETWKFWSQNLSPGVLRRGAPGVSRHGAMGFRGAAQGFWGAAPWGFEGQRHGISRGGATDKQMGPRGTAPNDKSLKSFISGAAPPNPMAPPLETPWRRPSKPLRRPSKPHGAVPRNPRCAAPQNPWGQNLRPKFSSFGGF